MNYVQFHVGDWDSSTRLLSPMEKGIYIDLLMLYYSLERPIMRSECDRIARAYADEERHALNYVLERFFTLDGDVYRHHRCDAEIEAVRAKSEKASKSAKARWQKEKQSVKVAQKEHLYMQDACKTDANAMRTQCERISERSADAMLTNNQEPITNIDNPLNPPSQGEAPDGASVKPKRKWQGLMTDRPDDVPAADWDQWIQIRKLKKLPVTDLAIEKMREEAKSAGLTLDQAVRKCIESGWGGFKASYLEQKQNVLPKTDRLGTGNPDEYLPNSRLKRQECRVYKRGI